jgi:predicted methyltransferase MtxX (methanogen marker protein 4)
VASDYIRGRRIKTRIAVRANGTVRLETVGRGKAVLRWLERMQGKKLLKLVGE